MKACPALAVIGIVGKQGSGKTTLFKLLTGLPVNIAQTNSGTVKVPDKRLDFLANIVKPKKTTHSAIELIDPPGFTKLSLSFIRSTDALIYVIPCFGRGEVTSPLQEPVKELKKLNSELILSDLETLEASIPRAKTSEEKELLNKCKFLLSCPALAVAGEDIIASLRSLELNSADEKFLRGFGFLSQKPVVVILNSDKPAPEFKEFAAHNNLYFLNINAKFELELACLAGRQAELSAEEQESYRQEFEAEKIDLERFTGFIYQSLKIITFFTVVGNEIRAWQAKEGTQAIQAAGMIHSDIERGFIKAEVINFEEFKTCDSFKTAKEKGLIRLVNKEYIVKDGDIIEFKFNV